MANLGGEFGRNLFAGMNGRPCPRRTIERVMPEVGEQKQQGNDAFGRREYAEAERHYTRALKLFHEMDTETREQLTVDDRFIICQIFTNRSACRLELGNFHGAVSDGDEAIEIHPCFWKAYYRKSKGEESLGLMSTSINTLLRGVSLGRPDRKQRCTMLTTALTKAHRIQPNPMDLLFGIDSRLKLVQGIVNLIQNVQQWQCLYRMLADKNEWPVIRFLLDVVQLEEMVECGVQVRLEGLVDYSANYSAREAEEWADGVALDLLLRGAQPGKLSTVDPPVFNALKLGLVGGEFLTLRYFMEFVLVRDASGKSATTETGQNLFQYIEQSAASRERKTAARDLLKTYGVGIQVERDHVLSGLVPAMLLQEGEQLHKNEEHEKLVVKMTEAIALLDSRTRTSDQVNFYMNRAAAYASLGRLMEARRDAKTALEMNPKCSQMYELLVPVCDKLHLEKEGLMNRFYKLGLDADEDVLLIPLLLSPKVGLPLEDVLKALNPSLSLWKRIIAALIENRAWSHLSTFFSLPKDKQGSLREYKADDVPLWRLACVEEVTDMVTYPPFSILLDRGAKPESLVPEVKNPLCKMHITGRPVSFAFINAMLRSPMFLDCLLERGEEEKEPSYPDDTNLLHRMIRVYKRLDRTSQRIQFISLLNARVVRNMPTPQEEEEPFWVERKLILDLNDPETAIYKTCNAALSSYNRS